MPFGPEEFASQTGVSRETLARLKAYADMLLDWIPDEAQRNRVLVDNPARLYDFK